MNSSGPIVPVRWALIVVGASASWASAQQTLYSNVRAWPDNYGVVTGRTTLSGVGTPQGASWSEVARDATSSNAIAGFAGGFTDPAGGFRFADDFRVPAGARWRIDRIVVYGYRPLAAGAPVRALDNANIQVWNGEQIQGGVKVWGNTTTNRVAAWRATNAFRVFNSVAPPAPPTPDFTRNVLRVELATPGLVLTEGTYWIDWQFVDPLPVSEIFCPPLTLPGSRGPADANAMQYRPLAIVGGGRWWPLIDAGKPASAPDVPQDLPFQVIGAPVCVSDLDLDGVSDLVDFFMFLNAFDSGDLLADVISDGIVDLADFFAFLNGFDAGC